MNDEAEATPKIPGSMREEGDPAIPAEIGDLEIVLGVGLNHETRLVNLAKAVVGMRAAYNRALAEQYREIQGLRQDLTAHGTALANMAQQYKVIVESLAQHAFLITAWREVRWLKEKEREARQRQAARAANGRPDPHRNGTGQHAALSSDALQNALRSGDEPEPGPAWEPLTCHTCGHPAGWWNPEQESVPKPTGVYCKAHPPEGAERTLTLESPGGDGVQEPPEPPDAPAPAESVTDEEEDWTAPPAP